MSEFSGDLELKNLSNSEILPKSSTFADKAIAEIQLFKSLPNTVADGVSKSLNEAWENKYRWTGVQLAGVAIAAAYTLRWGNPNPLLQAFRSGSLKTFAYVTAIDFSERTLKPASDVWNNPEDLELQKRNLGNRVGDAIVNYGAAVGSGIVGATLAERVIAPSALGEYIQGFKTVRAKINEAGTPAADGTAKTQEKDVLKNKNLPEQAQENIELLLIKADRSVRDHVAQGGLNMDLQHSLVSDLVNGKDSLVIREFTDGPNIASTSDGMVYVSGDANMPVAVFKTQRSFFNPFGKLELKGIYDGESFRSLSSLPSDRIAGFGGKDFAPGLHDGVLKPRLAKPRDSEAREAGAASSTGKEESAGIGLSGGSTLFNSNGRWLLEKTPAQPIEPANTGASNNSGKLEARLYFSRKQNPESLVVDIDDLTSLPGELARGTSVSLGEEIFLRAADVGTGLTTEWAVPSDKEKEKNSDSQQMVKE